jgi:hypothetical protein
VDQVSGEIREADGKGDEEGKRRRQIFFNGRYYDEILFGLTREEFDENEKGRVIGGE